ncbi:glycosyltransferase family 1 protein [Methylobacterium sp. WL64]|uniref:glycosyltransferase family 4 protein n=1 Tax=Methylobacterium sp. WL64 TaxID=2603894 RepID=UPI00164FC6A5|nr:glycosyltransferase family 1 protein [Methylobacterium sp. WL64]
MSTLKSLGVNGRFLAQSTTGVQRYALNVARSIGAVSSQAGGAVSIIAPPSTKNPDIEGLKFEVLGKNSGHIWEQFDLPHYYRGPLLNFCNTAPAVKSNQIVCIHDANVFLAPESYSLRFRAFYKIIQPILARRATKITTVSKFSARQISAALSVKECDIAVLPNGYEHVLSWNSALSDKARSAIDSNSDLRSKHFILVLGSRAKHKNIQLAIDLSAELSKLNLNLIIAGGQSKIFKEEYMKGADNIFNLGYVTDHDLAYLFERALCLVFPSMTEGFGLPVLEAMALGCPVISTDRASLPELCGDAALLASPVRPLEWIKHLQDIVASASLREDLIGRGRERAALFSWNKTALGYMSLL